jgi:hypothetical protein
MSPGFSVRGWDRLGLCSLLFLQAAVAAAAVLPGAPPLPDSPALQALVAATVGQDDVSLSLAPGGGGYTAAVRGGAAATIRDGGVVVSLGPHRWGLSAAAIGRQGSLVSSARRAPGHAVANRVDFAGPGAEAWFVNGPMGLEQGWTIRRRPAGGGDLRVVLALAGDLRTTILPDGRGATLAAASGNEVLRYAGLAAYDARGRALEAHFELGRGTLVACVRDVEAAYPVTVDPFVQVAKLVASDGAAGDAFNVVAVSGDGSTVVVGAPVATVAGHLMQGAAYVYSRPAGGWASATQVAKLTASDGIAQDLLGNNTGSVAVNSDGTTVAVAAPFATVAGKARHGAIYVFTRPGAAWSSEHETAKLTASDGQLDDYLGYTAVSGDGSTIVGGATDATVSGISLEGAAYVFSRPGTAWTSGTETAKLLSPAGVVDGFFGTNVAISTDGATIAIGAPGATIAGQPGQGAAYVFARPASGWATGTQAVATLDASDGVSGDDLGDQTAISGDGATIACGAPLAKISGAMLEGAVYVFVKPSAGWKNATQAAKLTESRGAAFDQLGFAVAVSGDGSTIVGGSANATIAGIASQGAAYLFVRPATGWANATQTALLTAADGAADADFGVAVAVSGDGSTVFAGAGQATIDGHAGQGAVYVFSAAGCPAGATTLCIDDQPGDRRWQVTASYKTAEGGGSAGNGEAIPLATLGVSEGGLFWFFDSTNPEMLIKVINACAVNQEFWVFSSATTNVGFTLTVTDTKEHRSKVYGNKDGTAAVPVQDTSAFACTAGDVDPAAAISGVAVGETADDLGAAVSVGTVGRVGTVGSKSSEPALRQAPVERAEAMPASQEVAASVAVEKASCATTATALCIQGRFSITVHYHTTQGGGSSGAGEAIALESLGLAQGGLFWFFAADNPEMLVKVIDACSLNNEFWVFYAAGTNVGFTLTVTDMTTGHVATFENTDGKAAPPLQDTSALPCK